MDNLPLQTMSFGFLILLLGAEKLSFESVSNVLGHTVCTVWLSKSWKKFGAPCMRDAEHLSKTLKTKVKAHNL